MHLRYRKIDLIKHDRRLRKIEDLKNQVLKNKTPEYDADLFLEILYCVTVAHQELVKKDADLAVRSKLYAVALRFDEWYDKNISIVDKINAQARYDRARFKSYTDGELAFTMLSGITSTLVKTNSEEVMGNFVIAQKSGLPPNKESE
jgi:hypothetical protein